MLTPVMCLIAAQGKAGGHVDPSLLAPVVRSRRTPIACTECRRRQVKVRDSNQHIGLLEQAHRVATVLWRNSSV